MRSRYLSLRACYLVFCFIFINVGLRAQLPANLIGNTPASLKWSYINTDKVEVIYPEGLDTSAQRVANVIEHLWDLKDIGIGMKREKVSIVLQAPSALSNGLVTVGPFRSEFFPAPRQFDHPTSFLDRLTIHEFRHVQQFSNSQSGITKLVKKVLGSWAWGGFMATALPRWYFEGDAVIAETEHTLSGRGRQPAFLMQYEALVKDGIDLSYEQASAGSIYRSVPDWFPLGHMILSDARKEHGDDVWARIVDDAVRYKGLLYPFNQAAKRHTGSSVSQLFDQSWASLKSEQESRNQTKVQQVIDVKTEDNSVVADYSMPHIIDGEIVAVKSTFDQLATIVSISEEGKEEELTRIGFQLDQNQSQIDASRSYVVWSEFGFDRRWRYKSYGDLYLYDRTTRDKTKLTSKERYSSPAISKDDLKLAAIYTDNDLSQSLHILNLKGEFLVSIEMEEYNQLLFPQWIDDHSVVLIANEDEESRIVSVNISSKEIQELTDPISVQLSHPSFFDGRVYYGASYGYVNNIYSVGVEDGSIVQHTDAIVGAYQPEVDLDNQELIYVELTSQGSKLKKTNLEELGVMSATDKNNLRLLSFGYKDKSILQDLPRKEFEASKFKKSNGLVNFHSLIPQFSHPNTSLSVLSDNVFGTLSGRVGASYNYNEDNLSYFTNWRYAGWYPELDVDLRRSNRSALFYNFGPLTDSTTSFTVFAQEWKETRGTFGVRLPLNFSKTQLSSIWSLSARLGHAKVDIDESVEPVGLISDTLMTSPALINLFRPAIKDGRLTSTDLSLGFFHGMRQARLQLGPRFGLRGNVRWRRNIAGDFTGADVFNLSLRSFWPGVKRSHSFSISYDYQSEDILDNYRHGDIYDYPRGYNVSLRRDTYSKWSFDYAFPIAYPDAALWGLAFIKRIKSNLFADIGRVGFSENTFNLTESMSSVGIELGVDLRFLRLLEVDLGVRYSYLLDSQLIGRGPHNFDFFVISITQ